VQAELHARTGSPTLGPTTRSQPATAPNTQPTQRYAIPKFPQNRRSLPPKVDGAAARPNAGNLIPNQSPQIQPVAASHLSSPALSTTKSPNFVPQGGTMSPSFGPAAQQNQQLRSQQPPPPPPLRPHFGTQRPNLVTTYPGSTASSASTVGSAMSGGSNYYPSPFQNHYDQLGKLSRFTVPPLIMA